MTNNSLKRVIAVASHMTPGHIGIEKPETDSLQAMLSTAELSFFATKTDEEIGEALAAADATIYPGILEKIKERTNSSIADYLREEAAKGPDMMKVLVAGMVNEHMIDETVKINNEALASMEVKTPSREMIKEMQEYAFRWRKKHPLANEDRVMAAVSGYFNLTIVQTNDQGQPIATQASE